MGEGGLRSGPSTRLRMLGMGAAQDARRWAAPSLFVSPVKTWLDPHPFALSGVERSRRVGPFDAAQDRPFDAAQDEREEGAPGGGALFLVLGCLGVAFGLLWPF